MKGRIPRAPSIWEETLAQQIRVLGLPTPTREFRFHTERKWRLDFAWPDRRVAVEVEGLPRGHHGRHTRAEGFERDAEKYNAAALAGWRLLRFTRRMIVSGGGVRQLELLFHEDRARA